MSRTIKAVLFDFGGVIIPQPQKFIAAYGQELKLPPKFLSNVFTHNVPNNAFCKLERGEYTLSEFFSKFAREAEEIAKHQGITLPTSFSPRSLMESFTMKLENKDYRDSALSFEVLHASTILQKNGIATCLLTNNWIDDVDDNMTRRSEFMLFIKSYFTHYVGSSQVGLRKPDAEIYELACRKLSVSPMETAFLDDIGLNLKGAQQLGITGIKVSDPIDALHQLEKITGVTLLEPNFNKELIFPAPSHPVTVSHGYVNTTSDIRIHFVEQGNGPVVILLHGFPDFWYGWRHQIPALANAGYRVIALDQRGFGESSTPRNIKEYSQPALCEDVLTVMDRLSIGVATVIGHDWGGSLAWTLALKHPNRFRAVCGVNTPFFPINPTKNPLVSMYKNPGAFDYQLYFQQPGIAEKEFEQNIRRSVCIMYQGMSAPKTNAFSTSDVRKRGGLFVGMPEDIPRSAFMTSQDLDYYVDAFRKSGFRGPLNWYRNYITNWKYVSPVAYRKISMPALMVTASHDFVLKPEYSHGMEARVTNLKRLHIDKCSHWTPQERPSQLNSGLIEWLDSIHAVFKSKL